MDDTNQTPAPGAPAADGGMQAPAAPAEGGMETPADPAAPMTPPAPAEGGMETPAPTGDTPAEAPHEEAPAA